MTFLQVLFYGFSAVAIFSALQVVTASNPVRGALFLVLTFFASAGLWMLLQAEFLALILVLVYVGAVMTLFLFVVMMLRVNRVSLWEGFVKLLPVSLIVVAGVMAIMLGVVQPQHLAYLPLAETGDVNNTATLGAALYTQFALPFEIAAVILLTAIVAAISLAQRTHPKNTSRAQNVAQQHAAQPFNRVRLVDLPRGKGPRITPKDVEQ